MSLILLHHLRPRLLLPLQRSLPRSDQRIQSGYTRDSTSPSTRSRFSPPCLIFRKPLAYSRPLYQQSPAHAQYIPTFDPQPHEFYRIIQHGQPDQIMNAFVDPRNESLVSSLSQGTFIEAFLLLSPAYFIIPYRDIHQPLHPTAVKVKRYKSLESIFHDFASDINTIVRIRESAGKALCLAEYKHLLDCARSMGDCDMANRAWHAMLHNPSITADLQCYNYYMEAKIWEKSYTGKDKYHLRVEPFAYRKRSNPHTRSWGWEGYGVQRRSVGNIVMHIFRRMTEKGILGDEATFVNIILAAARVGNLNRVKSVLKSVWNVDVDALCDQASEVPLVTPHDRMSPLYPTDRLLYAVAQSFGTNNDMGAAIRSVRFISRSYNVPIPEPVWHELFERAFVLSRPRRGPDAVAKRLGKVSPRLLLRMYDSMFSTSQVKPSVDIYRMLAKTAWDKRSLFEFQFFTREAYKRLVENRRKRKEARLILERYLAQLISPDGNVDPLLLQSPGFTDAVRTYDIHRLRTAQHTIIVERLARLLLINRWWDSKTDTAWERWHLPRVLEEWQDFLPQTFDFATTAGIVKFVGKSGWSQQYLKTHKNIPRRRAPDTEPDVEEEAQELDDDFYWERYKESSPLAKLDHFLLNRVFWDVGPGADYVDCEEEVVRQNYLPPEGATERQALHRLLHTQVIGSRRPPRGREHL